MTLTIGSFSTNALTAQPFGYEGDARQGLTARKWEITGLVTKEQWASLLSVYDTWRNTRISDAGSEGSGVVGTTVSFTGTGFNQTWSSIACWFIGAPTAQPAGVYLQATVQLIDATQALAVLEGERKKSVYVKSITVGGFSTTSLTAQPFGFEGDARKGLTARKWLVTGLLTTAEWTSLCSVYETWRDSRIADVESFNVNVVGSTVSFTGTGFGQSWSGVSCWFSQAPAGTPNGTFVDASFELVDATQAIQVLLREQQKSSYVKAVTIGTFTSSTLAAQPFGYEGTGRTGLTARKWLISGLLSTTQWASLCSVYDTWRDSKITEAEAIQSGVVGTTVSLTAAGFGQTWSNVACWFANPPSATAAGSQMLATVELVDATQALAVLLREQQLSSYVKAVTIGSFSAASLTAQPFGYEGEARTGLTARKWVISGLLTTAQWASLCGVYDTWRDLRITDADTLQSGTVGNTVALTAAGFGQTWTSVACWFTNPPSANPAGSYLDATVELVDANQALAVLLREQEKSRQNSEALVPSFGTITLGTVTLTPLEPPDGYTDTPQPQLSAGGRHYFTGPLGATATRRIRANVNATDYGTLRTWFEAQVVTRPASGVWYPINFPPPTAEVIITGGAKSTRYTVEIELVFTR
jgi:hypothetical protein